MTFGDTVKNLRKELGYSQSKLADQVGTTQRHLSFLETGRSRPSKMMVSRISAGLRLGPAQQVALFEASGFRVPTPPRTPNSSEIDETLVMIQNRILNHWPFPAFVLGRDWQILAANDPAKNMFTAFSGDGDDINFGSLVLSETFRAAMENWEEASAGIYFRLEEAARHSSVLAAQFAKAQYMGLFDHVQAFLAAQQRPPVYLPAIIKLPGGQRLQFTSLLGELGSVYDAIVEDFIIELIVPLDDSSQDSMLRNFALRANSV